MKKISEVEKNAIKKVFEYKLIAESNIVAIVWKNPDLYHTCDIKSDMFSSRDWRLYWEVGKEIIIDAKKGSLDDVTVAMHLKMFPEIQERYLELGGHETIRLAGEHVHESNLEGYVKDLKKWMVIVNLTKQGYSIADKLERFKKMSTEDIYDEYMAQLNHIFIDMDGDDKTYRMTDGWSELIDRLDKGMAVGLPYYNMDILNSLCGGALLGNITLIGGVSGSGKSTFVRNAHITSLIEHKEKVVVMANEEYLDKWQRELMVWVLNNVFKDDIHKEKVRNGRYSPEFKKRLDVDVKKWVLENVTPYVIFKPFTQYTTDKAIKTIRKYAHLGVKYFVLDTFKADTHVGSDDIFWLNMQQSMVRLYDTIKPQSLNVHLLCTFQLKKSSVHQRHFTMNNIGMSTGIIDVASQCFMFREVFPDELTGKTRDLKPYMTTGVNGKTKLPVTLHDDKPYQVMFVVKNREGATNSFSIITEHDLAKNTLKEVGVCVIAPD